MKIARPVALTAAAFSPRLAAWGIDRAWFTPPKPRISAKARALLDVCRPLHLDVTGRRVATWVAGDGPTVALMHGWGGYGAQLASFVEPLVNAGFRVAVFDALGHGASAPSTLGLRQGSFVDFARCLDAIRGALGPLFGVVAHSGGAVATGIALQSGLSTARLVLLAPMATPARYAARFDHALGIGQEVSDRWRARAARRAGFRWEDLDLIPIARRLEVPPTLLVHDRDDAEVPFAESEALLGAWPRATLYPTAHLGHRRILRDAGVIEHVTRFFFEARRSPATFEDRAPQQIPA